MDNPIDKSVFSNLINLYKEAVRKLPVLKFSWGIIVIICILALITYFKIGNPEALFKGSLYVIAIMFLIFIFSLIAKTNDKAIRYPLYVLVYSILLTITAFVIGFAIHSFSGYKFDVYYKLFGYAIDTSHPDSTVIKDNPVAADTIKKIDTGSNTEEVKVATVNTASGKRSVVDIDVLKVKKAEQFLNEGISLKQEKKWQQALDKFTSAIDNNPSFHKAYNHRGLMKGFLEDYTGAIKDFTTAIQLDPSNATYYCNRGVAKTKKEDCDGGINDINKAIELDPRRGHSFFQRAFAKINCFQDKEGACKDFSISCDLDYENGCNEYKNCQN